MPCRLLTIRTGKLRRLLLLLLLLRAVAKRLGADEVRVDLFVNPKDPKHPIVNEISLSSGQ